MTFEDLCVAAKKIGYKALDLLNPGEVAACKKLGLTCSLLNGAGSIGDNWNRKENHDKLEAGVKKAIDCAAENELPTVILLAGNRKGMPDDEGMENCAIGIKRIIGYAEQKKVTLVMELLNSKVDHKDYMCDTTAWGVGLCKKVGSERMKLLYDIYHMEIMESNLVATIKANKDYIGHYHTAGVPGRHEIDSTQKIDYPTVMKAIVETDYKGYVGQEFVPKNDPIVSLEQAFRICDV
jgi:hydroxypyruvate isomerase